jgi:hypothetical protein
MFALFETLDNEHGWSLAFVSRNVDALKQQAQFMDNANSHEFDRDSRQLEWYASQYSCAEYTVETFPSYRICGVNELV